MRLVEIIKLIKIDILMIFSNLIVNVLTGLVIYKQYYILKIMKLDLNYGNNTRVKVKIINNNIVYVEEIEKAVQNLEIFSYVLFFISVCFTIISLVLLINKIIGLNRQNNKESEDT